MGIFWKIRHDLNVHVNQVPGMLLHTLCIFIYANVLNWGGRAVLGKELNSPAKFMSETDTLKIISFGNSIWYIWKGKF